MDKDTVSVMTAIEAEDGINDWQVGIFDCRICGQRQTAVLPAIAIAESVECPNCGNMSTDPIEYDESEVANKERAV